MTNYNDTSNDQQPPQIDITMRMTGDADDFAKLQQVLADQPLRHQCVGGYKSLDTTNYIYAELGDGFADACKKLATKQGLTTEKFIRKTLDNLIGDIKALAENE